MEPSFYLSTFGGLIILVRIGFCVACNTRNASVDDPPPHWCLYDVDIDPANSVVVSIIDYLEGYGIFHHAYIETI